MQNRVSYVTPYMYNHKYTCGRQGSMGRRNSHDFLVYVEKIKESVDEAILSSCVSCKTIQL